MNMAARDGDGWIECACLGKPELNKHWGKHGAAGLLLVRNGEIFLQHRAPWVHNGDTWGIPGGARDSHESFLEAAIREAVEECGIDPAGITPIGEFTDDHGSWSYTTIFAVASNTLEAHQLNDEAHEVRWVAIDDVTRMPLHPSFEKTWPVMRMELERAIERALN
jgi:8-oxo-dGTP diphosphatase